MVESTSTVSSSSGVLYSPSWNLPPQIASNCLEINFQHGVLACSFIIEKSGGRTPGLRTVRFVLLRVTAYLYVRAGPSQACRSRYMLCIMLSIAQQTPGILEDGTVAPTIPSSRMPGVCGASYSIVQSMYLDRKACYGPARTYKCVFYQVNSRHDIPMH